MALVPLTQKQSTAIANNIVKCIKNNDMSLLTKSAYQFISICGGFIAHYDLQGFKDYYSDNINEFYEEILRNKMNCHTNYLTNEKNYEYYKSKADTYKLIYEQVEKL